MSTQSTSSSAGNSVPNLFNNNNVQDLSISASADVAVVPAKKSKAAKLAIAILSYVPVAGTVIGIKNAIKAYNQEAKLDNWKKAQIITQIFSFLILPQVILGCAYAIKALIALIPAKDESSDSIHVSADDVQLQDDEIQVDAQPENLDVDAQPQNPDNLDDLINNQNLDI